MLVHALVISRIVYCNDLYMRLPMRLLWKLQLVQVFIYSLHIPSKISQLHASILHTMAKIISHSNANSVNFWRQTVNISCMLPHRTQYATDNVYSDFLRQFPPKSYTSLCYTTLTKQAYLGQSMQTVQSSYHHHIYFIQNTKENVN